MTCKYKVKIKDIQYNYKVQMTDIQSKYKFKVFCTGYDDSEIKEKIDVMYQAWPKVSGEGETITLNDTANTTMAIDLKGNTYQDSTTGKNLLGLSNYSYNSNGVNCAVNNGIITLNGTATANAFIRIALDSFVFDANTYTLSANNTNTLSSNDLLRFVNANGVTVGNSLGLNIANASQNMTFNTTTDTLNLQIRIENGTTLSNFVIKPMLEVGSSSTSYEPYTNGASPNPSYPQDIHVVSGDNTIKVEGKNLFDLSTLFKNKFGGNTTSDKGITFTNNNGTINLNGTSTGTAECIIGVWKGPAPLIELDSSQTYTLKIFGKEKPGNTVVCGVDIRGIKNGSASKIIYGSDNTDTIELTGWSSIVYIDIYTQYTSGPINKNISIQLVKGSTIPTTYTPYVSQSYLISLGNIELCKIEDYKDRIYPLNGKWYLEKKNKKLVLIGTENWNYQSEHSRFIMNLSPRPVNGAMCYATTYIKGQTSSAGSNNTISVASGTGYSQLLIHDERFATKNDYNNWLSNNNVEVYYPLETPTTEEITDSTLISQLEEIKKAESYSGQTNISQTNDDKPFILTAKALKDLSSL